MRPWSASERCDARCPSSFEPAPVVGCRDRRVGEQCGRDSDPSVRQIDDELAMLVIH